MKLDTFQLYLYSTTFILLICIQNFDRCESFDGNVGDGSNMSINSGNENSSQSENEVEGSGSGSASASESEDGPEDLYFYFFDKESVVTEYQGPPDNKEKEEPDFLYHPEPGHIRIVEFYAHWCPHCQHFRPKYNAFAKKIKEIAETSKLHLDVYAVSCVPHRQLCRDLDIVGYPRVKLFVGDNVAEDKGIDIAHDSLHPFLVLKKIAEGTGISLSDTFATVGEKEEQTGHVEGENLLASAGFDNDSFWIPRTKYDIYCDAYLSFHFAMKNGIFVGRDLPSGVTKEAFQHWIALLNDVLPPSWSLKTMLGELLNNIETVLDSEENLFKIVDRYPPPRKKWSQSCSRGDPTMGYTCGLWQLFHITTVGVVEWNINNVVDRDDLYYTSDQVGQILRNYIEQFFGCEVCRMNFLHEYDNCGFHRCERLTTDAQDLDDWKELPLWLFEVHNGVSSRLLKERAERENIEPTQKQLISVQWPARYNCPSCWHADGRFDLDAVYSFLQLTYWPDELFSNKEKEKLHAATGITTQKEERVEGWKRSLVGLILVSALFTLVSAFYKQKEMHRTGKHKKADNDFV